MYSVQPTDKIAPVMLSADTGGVELEQDSLRAVCSTRSVCTFDLQQVWSASPLLLNLPEFQLLFFRVGMGGGRRACMCVLSVCVCWGGGER